MVVHTFSPSTWEVETGGFLWVQGQPILKSEFQDSQGYTEKLYLNKPKPNQTELQNKTKKRKVKAEVTQIETDQRHELKEHFCFKGHFKLETSF